MIRARRALGPIAALWLLCQAATLTLVPVLAGLGATAAGVAVCTCTHGADANCPMHHKAALGAPVCRLKSATASPVAALNALFGAMGVMPVSERATTPAPAVSRVRLARSIATARPAPPDPPPPSA
jgi:hypothetical protein